MAIICAILAVAVIIAGIIFFVGYLVVRPKEPRISVASAQLDTLYFDQTSLLTVQVSVVIKAENDNAKVHSSFYDMSLLLSFLGVKMAYLVAEPFDVKANSSVEFNYVPQSSPIPLNPDDAEGVSMSLRQRIITFDLKGKAKTRWRPLSTTLLEPIYEEISLSPPTSLFSFHPLSIGAGPLSEEACFCDDAKPLWAICSVA
ncbi:NDR1/HIN1-like protein 13 [Olea europaea var. sylvestris]|uniref:NDR1/HIN1-like protein 13 n=1 Tax=Olea europaea var. sylvestris TaxID=158386 RepID=UPI000C1CFAB8|nr:NDR1/HIN1-like protein 13 [Olea europaea var. sylvestris]